MKSNSWSATVEREGRKYYAYSEDFPGVYGLGKTIEGAKASILKSVRLFIQEKRRTPKVLSRKRN